MRTGKYHFLLLCHQLLTKSRTVYGYSCATGLGGAGPGGAADGVGGGTAATPSMDPCDGPGTTDPLSLDDDAAPFGGGNPCNPDEQLTYQKNDAGTFDVTVDGGDGTIQGNCVYVDRDYEACGAGAAECLLIHEIFCTSGYCV